jgi:hypothetical protein
MVLRGSFVLAAASVFSIAAAGCASTASSESESGEVASTVEAIVHVERNVTADATSTSVSAKFLRVLPEDAAKAASLVGTRVVMPAEGDCVPITSLSAPPEGIVPGARTDLKGSVELVDVGDLSLRATAADAASRRRQDEGDAFDVQLTPRAFPDVGDLVSGVFYTQPDVTADGVSLPAPGSYVISGTGAAQVEPFAIDASAPATPEHVRVSGRSIASPKGVPFEAGKDVSVDWDADGVSDGLVYIDVQGASPYRCTFKDSGAAVIPGEVLGRDDAGHEVALSVHRVRQESVELDLTDHEGRESALVRFDFARTGRLLVE